MKKTKLPLKFILISFLIWAVSLVLLTKISSRFLPNRTSYETEISVPLQLRSTILPWINFDGRNYLDIGLYGYRERAGQNLRGFLPLYPFVLKGLAQIGLNPIYSGLILNSIFFILSLLLLYKYTNSKKAILLLLLSPTAYYFLALYTESFFLFLVLLFFYSLKNKKYFFATISAILASATKVVGFSLPVILFFTILPSILNRKKIPWITLLSPVGIIALLTYFMETTGDPFIFVKSQLTFSRRIGIFSPFLAFFDWTYKVFQGPLPSFDSPFVYPIIILELSSSLLILFFIIKTVSKLAKPEWWYVTLSFLPIIFSGSLWSVPRYALVMFPLFTYPAKTLSRNWFVVVCIGSALLQIFLTSLFLRGYWVS